MKKKYIDVRITNKPNQIDVRGIRTSRIDQKQQSEFNVFKEIQTRETVVLKI